MLLMEERRKKILKELVANETVYVSELSKEFDVSYETIRKDLAQLEEQGYCSKSHGGATIKQNAVEHSFDIRQAENIDIKKRLARKAIELIPENSSIIIATGSTTLEVAKLLASKSGYKIYTDSLPVAVTLMPSNNQVFILGGQIRQKSSSVFGGWTLSALEGITVDIAFIGTDGFSNINGPTSPSYTDAHIDQIIIQHSHKTYVLGDNTKFTRNSLYKICDWSQVSGLITDSYEDNSHTDEIAKQTKVYIC